MHPRRPGDEVSSHPPESPDGRDQREAELRLLVARCPSESGFDVLVVELEAHQPAPLLWTGKLARGSLRKPEDVLRVPAMDVGELPVFDEALVREFAQHLEHRDARLGIGVYDEREHVFIDERRERKED